MLDYKWYELVVSIDLGFGMHPLHAPNPTARPQNIVQNELFESRSSQLRLMNFITSLKTQLLNLSLKGKNNITIIFLTFYNLWCVL